MSGGLEERGCVKGRLSGHRQPLGDTQEHSNLLLAWLLEKEQRGLWPAGRVRPAQSRAAVPFWAAFSQLLLRCWRGRFGTFFQSVWAVWDNSYLTGLHFEAFFFFKKKGFLYLLRGPKTKSNQIYPEPAVRGRSACLVLAMHWVEEQGSLC